MKIQRLVLNNVRSIEGELVVRLNNDVNLNLVSSSNNGMGKTTIFHTIYFLLFGITPDTIESMVNWNSDSMSASMDFVHNGDSFSIDYKYDNGKAEKSLIINGEKFNGITVCHKKIKEYFDPSLFIGATRLLQNEKNFVNVKDSERRESLKKVFNTDYSVEVKEIEKEIKDIDTKELEIKINFLKAQTFEEKSMLDLPLSADEYEQNKKIVQDNQTKIAVLNQQILTIEKDKKELESLKSQLTSVKNSLSLAETKLTSSKHSLESYSSYTKDESTILQYRKELEEIKLERIKPFDEESLNTEQSALNTVLSDIRILTKKINDCKSGICPVCGKEFSSHDIGDTETELQELSSKKASLEQKIEELKSTKKVIEESIKKNNESINKKVLLENKIKAEETRLQTEFENNEKFLLLKKDEIFNIEKQIQDFITFISELELKIASKNIKSSEELLLEKTEIESSIEKVQSLISLYDKVIMSNELNKKYNDELAIKKQEVKDSITKAEVELQELQDKVQGLEKMRVFLKKEFPSYVIGAVIEDIQNSMNEFINKVYYKPLEVVITGNDDVISVKYGSGKKKVDCINASGAEEALLAVAYCAALNSINKYGIFILDEIDANFTESNSLQLAEIMIAMKDDLDDLWIISHVDATKDLYASNGANIIMVGE
jgi:DNA repair exonuclease SbcCD ATPase subunit